MRWESQHAQLKQKARQRYNCESLKKLLRLAKLLKIDLTFSLWLEDQAINNVLFAFVPVHLDSGSSDQSESEDRVTAFTRLMQAACYKIGLYANRFDNHLRHRGDHRLNAYRRALKYHFFWAIKYGEYALKQESPLVIRTALAYLGPIYNLLESRS